jgi:type IV secretion system protein VirB6
MKFRRYIASLTLALVFVWISSPANSGDFLKDCVKGFDFGGTSGIKTVEVLPAGKSCTNLCERECRALSRKTRADPNIEGSGIELNSGPILDCMANCRNNDVDTKYIIRQDYSTTNTTDIKYTKVSIGAACDPIDVTYSGFIVASGDKVTISLANTLQKVYLCGKKQASFEPIFSSTDANKWNVTNAQNMWSSKNMHKCTFQKSDADWNGLTNKKLWELIGLLSDPCKWSARNPSYMDTGIYVQDGDELSISFGGDFAPASYYTRKILFDKLNDPNADNSRTDYLFELTGRLHVKPPSNSLSDFPTLTIYGEKARPYADVDYRGALKNIGKKVDTTYLYGPDRPSSMDWYGLQGMAYDIGVKTSVKSHPDCDTSVEAEANYNECHVTTDPGTSNYVFGGILKGFSDKRTLLAVKHPDVLSAAVYADNIGGDSVSISWAGCPYEDGARLQYAIIDGDTKALNSTWKPLLPTDLNGENPITMPASGELVFKITPLQAPNGLSDEIKKLYDINNRFGSYTLFVSKPDDSGYINHDGPFRSIVKKVYSTLFGTPGKMKTVTRTVQVPIPPKQCRKYAIICSISNLFSPKYETKTVTEQVPDNGVVGLMYDTLVKDSQLINSVLALCVLYITFVGIGFIIGTIELKQEDLIMRVVKLAVVIAVISPGSTQLFYENFLSQLIVGGAQLIAIIATGSLKNTAGLNLEMLNKDPTLMFVIFDGLWTQFGETKLWIKIGTLFFYGFMGAFMALLVLISILYYTIAVLKSCLTYMMSLVILSILIFAAPFFIPLMLFQQTKLVFDTWWKMIISYLLQPVGLFAGIAIFNTLFAGALYSALAFTVCPYCFLLFKVPFFDFCLIPWWQPMYRTFEPDGIEPNMFNTPAGSFETIFILLIIAQGMMYYVEFITKVIGSIVSGQLTSRSTDLSAFSGRAAHMAVSGAGSVMKTPVRIQQARSAVLNLRQKYKEGRYDNDGDQRRR